MNDDEEVKREMAKAIEYLQNVDRFRHYREDFEGMINWSMAIAVGSLLVFISNFDKFKIGIVMPNKVLFLLGMSLLAVAAIAFLFIRALLYLRTIAMNAALGDLEGLPKRAELSTDSKSRDEILEMMDRIGKRSIRLWLIAHNLFPHPVMVVFAWACLITGLIAAITYVFTFVLSNA